MTKNVLHDAIFQCLRSITIFSELTTNELNFIAGHMHVLKTVTGGTIFKENDPGDFVCFVVEGRLAVLKTTNRAEKAIAELTAGQSIGEMAVVGNFPRSATVRSVTDATLLTLKRDRLNQICDEHPDIGVKIFKAIAQLLSHHLRKTSENLSELMPRAQSD
jgi:CRP-like cAMP-binding protein